MRATDAAGIVRLLGLGARGVRSVVERTHLAVQQTVYRGIGTATSTRAEPVGRAHDGYVAGIHRLVDAGLLGAEHLARAIVLHSVAPTRSPVMRPRCPRRAGSPSWSRHAARASRTLATGSDRTRS